MTLFWQNTEKPEASAEIWNEQRRMDAGKRTSFLRTLKKRERAEYSVWGCFQSGSQLVKGSWKVAFFLNP